ncbi:hypothetical protein LJ721_004719 [Salmonella enterica]|nr:hypothetical protein [Salmonella enterica]
MNKLIKAIFASAALISTVTQASPMDRINNFIHKNEVISKFIDMDLIDDKNEASYDVLSNTFNIEMFSIERLSLLIHLFLWRKMKLQRI